MSCINKHIIVIGGGVAGLFASVMAAHHGCKVTLFEKMNRVGLKMGITGKGRCNITNAKPITEFIKMTPEMASFYLVLTVDFQTKIYYIYFMNGDWKRLRKEVDVYFLRVKVHKMYDICLCVS